MRQEEDTDSDHGLLYRKSKIITTSSKTNLLKYFGVAGFLFISGMLFWNGVAPAHHCPEVKLNSIATIDNNNDYYNRLYEIKQSIQQLQQAKQQEKIVTKTCEWKFSLYIPSEYETYWFSNIHKDEFKFHACERLLEEKERAAQFLIMNWNFMNHPDKLTEQTFVNITNTFSQMKYEKRCVETNDNDRNNYEVIATGFQLIEPLQGFLRDPLTFCPGMPVFSEPQGNFDLIQSKRFILLASLAPFKIIDNKARNKNSKDENWVYNTNEIAPWLYSDSKKHSAQRILFDLGSSYYGSWSGANDALASKWFVKYIHSINRPKLEFTRIIAFEFEKLEVTKLWSDIPDELMSIYTPINQGVSIELDSKFNPWNILRKIAKPNDYVVIKVDVDTPKIENSLFDQLVADKELLSLVDEICYEHHVNLPELKNSWGTLLETSLTLQDTYNLFVKLRIAGVRSHSWP
jgi:hypothetical protein